jgi:hypothetical protein
MALSIMERNHQRVLRSHEQLHQTELESREDDISRLSSEYEAKLADLRIELGKQRD